MRGMTIPVKAAAKYTTENKAVLSLSSLSQLVKRIISVMKTIKTTPTLS